MESILQALLNALSLIIRLDRELLSIVALTFQVSGLALLLSVLAGLPAGAATALARFPGRGMVVSTMNTFTGLPPVVVGLFVYLLLSRKGPLGFLGLLYTPSAMIIAQTVLALPIVAALSHAAVVAIDPSVRQAAVTLGATPFQTAVIVLREARYGVLSAVAAAFGRVMAEVGAILIVGGNIAGRTRVITTTIALETDKGNFELALALGLILLAISLMVNGAIHYFQAKGRVRTIP